MKVVSNLDSKMATGCCIGYWNCPYDMYIQKERQYCESRRGQGEDRQKRKQDGNRMDGKGEREKARGGDRENVNTLLQHKRQAVHQSKMLHVEQTSIGQTNCSYYLLHLSG